MLGRLGRREGAREIITRIAARAGVELGPAECWLLARLSNESSPDLDELAKLADVAPARLQSARDALAARALIEPARTGALRTQRQRPYDACAADGDRRAASVGPARGLAASRSTPSSRG